MILSKNIDSNQSLSDSVILNENNTFRFIICYCYITLVYISCLINKLSRFSKIKIHLYINCIICISNLFRRISKSLINNISFFEIELS